MLLAVAITRTGELFSDIKVRKVPNNNAVVPASVSPDDLVPVKDLSISSIQQMQLPKA